LEVSVQGISQPLSAHAPSDNGFYTDERWLDLIQSIYGYTVTRLEIRGNDGALQGYRVRRGGDPKSVAEMLTFSGRSIDVPSMYVAGKSDWGVYQTPGAVDKMRERACTKMLGFHLLDGAGHWVLQEQPEQVSALLLDFLRAQNAQ